MIETIFRRLLLACCVVAIAAPASAANKEHQQLMADIRMLQEQAQQLQNLLGQVGEALKAVNARIDEQTNATRKAFADQKLTVDTLSSDLRVVREKVDDNNVRIGSLTQELDALRQGVSQMSVAASDERRTRRVGAPAAPLRPPFRGSERRPMGTDAAVTTQRSPTTPRASGISRSRDSKRIIRSFPKSDKAADAQVKIGDAYVFQNKYDKGLEAYDNGDPHVPGGGRRNRAGVLQEGARAPARRPGRSRARGVRGVHREAIPNGPQQGEFAILCKQAIGGKEN